MCVVCDRLRVRAGVAEGAGLGRPGATAGSKRPQRVRPDRPPQRSGEAGRRIVIRGATILTMDPAIGDFATGDILVEGRSIVAVGKSLDVGSAEEVDARGMIVTPGFIDTHHHQFETALRSFLADGILLPDGKPHGEINYYNYIIERFAPVYTPDDIYISILAGSLSQLDAGVTSVLDVSQVHFTPECTDAVAQALQDCGRRSAMGYFGGHELTPEAARNVKLQYFSSDDQLLTMVMGGEMLRPDFRDVWKIGRELGVPIALHVVGTFGMAATFDEAARAGEFGPDNIFIHMTGMSELAWKAAADAGAHVSLAVPIEMHMRHGQPPIQRALSHDMQPSLSSDVECTMTADPFTQMRSALTLQRMLVNDEALAGGQDLPELLTARDVLRFATVEGAKGLRLDRKVGSITPGREADLVFLDAAALNVAPLNNAAGAVVTLMERSNVEAVMVAGKFRKWNGALLDVHVDKVLAELEASRDGLFERAGIPQDLLRT